jgi:hypothetical protein
LRDENKLLRDENKLLRDENDISRVFQQFPITFFILNNINNLIFNVMTNLLQILILLADNFSGFVNVLLASAINPGSFLIVFAAAVITYSDIPAEALAAARRWHGTIDDQFSNIDNLVTMIQRHSAWRTPPSVFSQILTNRTQLAALIQKCRSTQGSSADRNLRSVLLKLTVGMCLAQVIHFIF